MSGVKPRAATSVGVWLSRPLTSFHLVVTLATLLTALGLIMVLSASSVESFAADGSAYSIFVQQVTFTLIGAVLFYVALRTPIRVIRGLSLPAVGLSIVLLALVLVPGIGTQVQGARRWFVIAGQSVQPSEITKIALAIWGAHLLATRRPQRGSVKELLIPLIPVSLVIFVLVILEPNLSTMISLGIIVVALLWFAGLQLSLFLAAVAAAAGVVTVLALTAGYRSARMQSFFDPGNDPQGIGYQAREAKFALADGGLWGVGLGASRAKWSYLPNAHNDFIFAIMGEELGFVGCAAVIGLFGLFAYTGMRIAARSIDPFLRLLTGTATVWVIGQAFINIGYVVGLLPVTGLQLPLISAGGSSTAMTLLMFGIVANAARHEPEAVAALHGGRDSRMGRLMRLPKPDPYSAVRTEAPWNRPDHGRTPGSGRGHDRIPRRTDAVVRPPTATTKGRATGDRRGEGRQHNRRR